MEVIGLASHMDEAVDAVELLREQAGVDRVGVLGARFGGTVAALVADRLDLPFMALFEPMTNGAQYMRDLLRTRLFAEMAGGKEEAGAPLMDQLRHELAAQGWLDVKGLRLARQAYDAWSEVEAAADTRLVTTTGGLDLWPAGAAIPLEDYTGSLRAEGVPFGPFACDIQMHWGGQTLAQMLHDVQRTLPSSLS